MRAVFKTEFHDGTDGKTYEIRQMRKENADGEVFTSIQIIKRPYFDQNVVVSDFTKDIIDKIRKGNK